jgi:hypothetical protein
MSYDNLSSVSQNVLKFYKQLTGEERRIPFIFYVNKHGRHRRFLFLIDRFLNIFSETA